MKSSNFKLNKNNILFNPVFSQQGESVLHIIERLKNINEKKIIN